MEIALTLVLLLSGAFAGRGLAKWRGLNVPMLTAAGFLFSLFAIPAGFLMRADPEKSSGSKGAALSLVALWLACFVGLVALGARDAEIDGHRETINAIIKDNFANATVEADYVSLPVFGFGPFFLSQYDGYFTIKGKGDGAELSPKCRLITVDFSARATADNYILTIPQSQTNWPACGP